MSELSELIEARRAKLKRLKESGVKPYAYGFALTHRLSSVLSEFSQAAHEESSAQIAVCGRIVSRRDHGKTSFMHIEDATARLQVYLKADVLGAEIFAGLDNYDIGDFAGFRGKVFRTRTGEITVKALEAVMLAKALRPPPEKWHGLKDTDARYRRRYVDLMANAEVRRNFKVRAEIIQAMRDYLNQRGFLEVETPVLQPLYGGAEATPFKTYYESLDRDYFLRISNELYLKRLLVGGMDRVYEFSKDFRNEGIDRTHNPEFTLLELYQAYADYTDMMTLTEEIMREAAVRATGGPLVEFAGKKLDFSKPWPRVPFVQSLNEKLGYDSLSSPDDELRKSAKSAGIPGFEKHSRPKLLDKLFTVMVQESLVGPAFVVNHPVELSPLAKADRNDPRLAERFEPIIAGEEVGNAFSELNDPEEQRSRFEQQAALMEKGEKEAHRMDSDFIESLEYGMPPAGGLGIGIDRLAMILTDTGTLREVILFPQLKSDSGQDT